MAATTYLQLINAVLRRLRKETVASPDASDYVEMIGELINEAKVEVENATAWEALWTQTDITTQSGTKTYTLTGYGDRARIQFIYDDTNNADVHPAPHWWIERQRQFTSDPTGVPRRYCLNGLSNGDPLLELWPTPAGTYTIKVHSIVPQAALSDAADTLSVPPMPVILGAYALAVSERGEDGGVGEGAAHQRAQRALSEAIAIDNLRRNRGQDTDWFVAQSYSDGW